MDQYNVYVQGRFANGPTRRIFAERGYNIIEHPDKADIIVWTGGEDIHPQMYKEKPIPGTYYNMSRDIEDVSVYEQHAAGKVCIGICRGAQLLTVLNNGRLWQDIDGHCNGPHNVVDAITGKTHVINSLHHQQMILPEDKSISSVLVAYSMISQMKLGEKSEWYKKDDVYETAEVDPEVVWFPRTQSLCFQAHPEFGHLATTEYFFELVGRYALPI